MYKMTEQDIIEVMAEFNRRLTNELKGEDITIEERKAMYRERMQGVFGTLMALSSNWPEVVDWVDNLCEPWLFGWDRDPYDY